MVSRLREAVFEVLRYAEMSVHAMPEEVKDACRVCSQWIDHGRWPDEHPADDDEPIERSWLATIGGNREDHPLKVTFHREDALPIGLWSVDDGWKAMVMHSENAATCVVRGLKYRCDVRRLCALLGIPLVETQSSK